MPAPRNRTLNIDNEEIARLAASCPQLNPAEGRLSSNETAPGGKLDGKLYLQDAFEILPLLPDASIDLMIADPPYNLYKDFHGFRFAGRSHHDYMTYLHTWLPELSRILKPGGSLYLCTDWRSGAAVQLAASEFFDIRNRITWEREKGRGAKTNWKNTGEDIWFCTHGEPSCFNINDVKVRKRVVAPYRNQSGHPKDWVENSAGCDDSELGRFRDTCPGNIWTDLTVPFWSMPENTDHPTQKPEKLMAKLILASSRPGDIVFDPFAGSGTSLVTAAKLGRRWLGIEQNPVYAAWSLKRLERAQADKHIQGYDDGVFRERNSG